MNITSRFSTSLTALYSIFGPLRNLSLYMIILISFEIRSKLIKIPYPPLCTLPFIFLYEHKMLYKMFHEFTETISDKKYLLCLELGLYVNMYTLHHKKRHLVALNKLCKRLQLPEFGNPRFEQTEIFIEDSIDYISPSFFNSTFYQIYTDSALRNSECVYL